ncbi:MAG TPA: bifunctional histidinol-phosphatase/imidazoleglycerol-phosphate dehydratase HisB [Candidatus Avimuribaculum pullicola]|nr:bifunctional histidinol-phosphatase/imidazoleglycerol-phosphate dehydratase HisB [Candidatus Avimuribaculum pullicola]
MDAACSKQPRRTVLFIDRDGTLVVEPPVDYQLDSLAKFKFVPGVIRNLAFIASTLDYELVMVSNQDGLGTDSFPMEDFLPPHRLLLDTLAGEGVQFDDIIIDTTFPHENKPTRKPGTALLGKYMGGDYDLAASYVIGDRLTDVMLARNLGARAIYFAPVERGRAEVEEAGLGDCTSLVTDDWGRIADFLRGGARTATVERCTAETDIKVSIDLDGTGRADISTGIGFFDHILSQIARHSGIDLAIKVRGDLWVDEHHTIEDTAIVLGEALRRALGDKRGIERYGFVLPMDDCDCTVALDFGGRAWLLWDAEFRREKIGEMPTEMFRHFFKSLSDAAAMNLYISAHGENEHHKIEGIFKALARALRSAIRRDIFRYTLPTTKGLL